jgi:hypothetical protein
LHHLSVLAREVERRQWPSLFDSARVGAKVALDKALDRIDDLAPDRKEEVALIEEAARHFHTCDEFEYAATYGGAPLPVMKRASERAAAANADKQEAA